MARKATKTTDRSRQLNKIKTLQARFEKATANLKRVMIAKDALALLRGNREFRRRIGQGGYFAIIGRSVDNLMPQEGDSKEETQLLFHDEEFLKRCQVCALGACFISAVRLGNDYDIKEAAGNAYGDYLDSHEFWELLERYFSKEQMGLIEAAFEHGTAHYEDRLSGLALTVASLFTKKFQRPGNRRDTVLEAILENIIRNRGVFKPLTSPGMGDAPKIARQQIREEKFGYDF